MVPSGGKKNRHRVMHRPCAQCLYVYTLGFLLPTLMDSRGHLNLDQVGEKDLVQEVYSVIRGGLIVRSYGMGAHVGST